MVTKSLTNYAVAAAFMLSAIAASSAPAFAWGAGAPDNLYGSNSGSFYDYYDYAPRAAQAAPVSPNRAAPNVHRHELRNPAVEQR